MSKKTIILSSLLALLIFSLSITCTASNYLMVANEQEQSNQFKFTFNGTNPIEGSLAIENKDKVKDLYLQLYGVDGMTGNNGNSFFKTLDQEQTKIGKWLTFEENDIQVKPGETKLVRFKILVPEKTLPGFYVGGISIVENPPKEILGSGTEQSQNFGAKIQTRIVKKVFLSIPGEKITKYAVSDLQFIKSSSHYSFQFSVENQGNSLLSGNGRIEIRDEQNNVVNIPVKIANIMENEMFNGDIYWNNPPAWGRFTARLSLELSEYDPFKEQYSVIETVTKQTSFIVTDFPSVYPYIYASASFLLLLIIIILISVISNYNYKKHCIEYVTIENDTINSVAEKFGMKWKKLADINRIKAPYGLTAGTKILVRPKNNG
jgi:hypothetical protein